MIKYYCDRCGGELGAARPPWALHTPGEAFVFCGESCVLGWLVDRDLVREEKEDEATAKSKKERLVAAVEMMLDAAHDFLDEECEGAIKRD